MSPVFFGFGILLLVLQTTTFHLLPSWLGRPDLLFLLLCFIIIYFETGPGLILTLLLGMLVDVFSGIHLGVHSLAYLLLFLVLRTMVRNLAIQGSPHQVPLVITGYLATTSFVHLLATLLAPENPVLWTWPLLLQNVIILGIICLPFFHLCQRLMTLLAERPPRSWIPLRRRPPNRFKV
ncbi:rod shape-determining protein MreD [Desulfurivibrio alkaliphilus]|uniref:Rod shape-determining protein MreD n=1 Tax=Desulfurivibrio alkaliphilus (strain DSM 19089 / UNIQEM U267 / AHT2) TaxID=589865 RepID=D6Z4Z0_DESAT|nr:rod shape-determining protein MreD [Desulfurivibrio alkaliphilus]ADH86615.1 rod shape-determining protein MreD [Desulfurivibrio alkaliphilus AHT 2]